jgi:hypothetical protein
MVRSSEAERLAEYIRSLPGFVMYTQIDGNYGHIGATLADAVLQSNNNYEKNVRQRIARIRQVYERETSLQDLKRLLQHVSPQDFLNWNGTRKPTTFCELVDSLEREGVNTEDDLLKWLTRDGSCAKLDEIRFVGRKTVDYICILVGLPKAAMNRHLFRFLERAGIEVNSDYERGQEIVHQTADLMGVDRAYLDHSIWRYMSGDKTAVRDGRPGCS